MVGRLDAPARPRHVPLVQQQSFVGGMRYRATGGAFSGRPNLSWPLARLDITETGVTIRPRGQLGRLVTLGWKQEPTVAISFEMAERTEAGFGYSGSGLRFRTGDPRTDGAVFWAARRDRSKILAALERVGHPPTAIKRPWC